MALALEIEFLGGVCFAAICPDNEAPDWPPQPDRIFSALVTTWGAHEGLNQAQAERAALEWLEQQPPPMCAASDREERTTPSVFVPPNDYAIPSGELQRVAWFRNYLGQGKRPPKEGGHKKLWQAAWSVMPDERKRSGLKERLFPAARPHDPVIRYFWNEEPEESTLNALDQLARDTAYVGHSASLTRCRFMRSESAAETAQEPKRRIYKGRLQELSESYMRFLQSANKKDRPRPGDPMTAKPQTTEPRRSVFLDRWLILEHIGGEMPDARAAAIVARGIRTALMSGYGQVNAAVPAWVSGHESDGKPAREEPHMAVVPLSFTGFPHADGRVLGFALVPPSNSDLLEDETFRKVLRTLAPLNDVYGRRVLEVKSAQGAAANQAFALKFSPSFEVSPGRRSLDPALYIRAARRFATVTPIVLDRFLKKQGEARSGEISEQIAVACERIGLPRPVAVFPDKHSALQGAVSAYPSGRGPAWLNWRLPDSLAGRQLTHAVIEFAEPIEGPVLLGAGRFLGMGLCRALGGEKR